MVNICVLALIGLPGAGKTSFCKKVLECPSEYNVAHICYDEIFNFNPESNKSTFKTERKKAIHIIEEKINDMKSVLNFSTFNVILVDDNNYYAGMRYEIYKICKANQIAFGQLYFPLELECALVRNVSREEKALPSDVITLMNSRLEIPMDKNQWEQNTLVIHNSLKINEFFTFLEVCSSSPVRNAKEVNTHIPEASLIHKVDLCLRKRIKYLLQNCDGNPSARAKILNQKRKCILLDIKKRNLSDDKLDVDSISERLT